MNAFVMIDVSFSSDFLSISGVSSCLSLHGDGNGV